MLEMRVGEAEAALEKREMEAKQALQQQENEAKRHEQADVSIINSLVPLASPRINDAH